MSPSWLQARRRRLQRWSLYLGDRKESQLMAAGYRLATAAAEEASRGRGVTTQPLQRHRANSPPSAASSDGHLAARLRAFAVTRDAGTIAPLCDIAAEASNSYITFARGRNGDVTRRRTGRDAGSGGGMVGRWRWRPLQRGRSAAGRGGRNGSNGPPAGLI